VAERPKEWLDGFTNYYTSQGFGLANNLQGLEGVIKILEARSKLEIEIYSSLTLTKYKISNATFDFNLLKHNINSIIQANDII
jgi:hypothetical protein